MKASMVTPVVLYDFRLNAEGLSEQVIITSLKRIAKHFIFQEERGEASGYLHYQGRMSLMKKRRKHELMKDFKDLDLEMPVPNYLEPTTSEEFRIKSFSYVIKDVTRTRGPWSDKDEKKYIPRQYRNLLEKLYPYQKVIFDSANIFDTRSINLIYCPKGNIGKSTIASLCELFGKGIDLPPINDSEKLIQSCCDICIAKDIRDPSPVFIDMPRAMGKERLYGIYTAIEQIKKGKLFDLRYSYKEYWIDSPQIWVFSNLVPDLELLSHDRWKIWTVDDDMNLVKYDTSLIRDELEIKI